LIASGQEQDGRLRSPEKDSRANRDRRFSRQANGGQGNVGCLRHRDGGVQQADVSDILANTVFPRVAIFCGCHIFFSQRRFIFGGQKNEMTERSGRPAGASAILLSSHLSVIPIPEFRPKWKWCLGRTTVPGIATSRTPPPPIAWLAQDSARKGERHCPVETAVYNRKRGESCVDWNPVPVGSLLSATRRCLAS
jgi:hypothetical protein